jgi:hypothetical protein
MCVSLAIHKRKFVFEINAFRLKWPVDALGHMLDLLTLLSLISMLAVLAAVSYAINSNVLSNHVYDYCCLCYHQRLASEFEKEVIFTTTQNMFF